MVRLARRKLPEKVRVIEADAEALPFPDASFDVVYSNLCLQLVNEPSNMVAELFRVVRPGGLRLHVDYLPRSPHYFPGRVAVSVWGWLA